MNIYKYIFTGDYYVMQLEYAECEIENGIIYIPSIASNVKNQFFKDEDVTTYTISQDILETLHFEEAEYGCKIPMLWSLHGNNQKYFIDEYMKYLKSKTKSEEELRDIDNLKDCFYVRLKNKR